MSEKPFFVDYDKRGAAKCKKCKEKLEKGIIRIAKHVSNPFSEEGGVMKHWYHVACLFESFKRARATTKKLEDPLDDVDGWDDISQEDQQLIKDHIKAYLDNCNAPGAKKNPTAQKPTPAKPKANPASYQKTAAENKSSNAQRQKADESTSSKQQGKPCKDELFKEFRKLCANIAEESSYLGKTGLVSELFDKGSDGESFKGNLRLWVRLLLPGVVKRVYNLQSRQLTKLFAQLFDASLEEMLEDLEKGDIAETIRVFFESSTSLPPVKKSTLTLRDVDDLLTELEGQTTEESHMHILKKAAKRSTGNDLKMFIRLIKGDLRINAGAKHILEGVHPDAYEAFQTTRNLDAVLEEVLSHKNTHTKDSSSKGLSIQAKVMTPVLPMLAMACKSVEQALKKCPNGMYAEIKYDGERVQLHKKGNQFSYFSRSLKPVMSHKVSHFKDHIPSAFPHGSDLILDAEVLLIDTNTSLPLPFGTLGKHKKGEFKDANVCLFVFDCIHYNGVNLMDKSIQERRKILEKNMVEIRNHVVLSEMKEVHKAEQLNKMINSVLKQGLEGLVLKDLKSIYEPGKRHWLKVKKDYLQEGAMADSADLVVLGAWYGTGKKGGMMSVFLMGCFDTLTKKWCTVTKVHTGHDDAALERLQTELQMDKISQNYEQLPSWIKCSKPLTPDFVAKDPKTSAVWEITGAEFTQNQIHSADGISIRFPRVTKERKDKDWTSATDLAHLIDLYKASKEHSDVTGLQSEGEDSGVEDSKDYKEDKKDYKVDIKESKKDSNEHKKGSKEDKKGSKDDKKDSKEDKKDSKEDKKDSKEDKKDSKEDKKDSKEERKNKRKMESESHSSGTPRPEPSRKKFKTEREGGKKQSYYEPPIRHPLPNVFENVKMHLPNKSDDDFTLRRYFLAFGGEILDEFSEGATHRLHKQNGSCGKSVTMDWLWDSIKLKELQPTEPYES